MVKVGGKTVAIHRTWTLNPAQKREWRIKQDDPAVRTITNGCINIESRVFDEMKTLSKWWKVEIKK